MSSRPPSTDSLDEDWALFEDDPALQLDDEVRTIQMRSPFFEDPPEGEEKTSDERETVPPPVPVSEYVQTMMQQAPDEPDPPLSSPFSWHNAMPPSSRQGAPFQSPTRRPDFPPASLRALAPPPPPSPPPPGEDDDSGAFTLIAFEPERLGDAPGDFEEPRFSGGELTLSPDFEDISFAHVISASEPSTPSTRFPTPVPVFPSSRVDPPASIPPILDMAWAASPAERRDDFADLDEAPRTSRGLAAPTVIPGAHPASPRFDSLDSLDSLDSFDDAGGLSAPPSSRRLPLGLSPSEMPPALLEPFDEVRELYEAGDFRSALVMAEALLEAEPGHLEARSYAVSCRETLLKKYLARLGGSAKIIRVAMPPDEIRWLSLDHKAGFLLACIDGTSTIEEVLDVSCMQEFEAIRILHDFRELGVIEILPDPRSPRR